MFCRVNSPREHEVVHGIAFSLVHVSLCFTAAAVFIILAIACNCSSSHHFVFVALFSFGYYRCRRRVTVKAYFQG